MIHWHGTIGIIVGFILGVGFVLAFQKLWNWIFEG